MALRYVFLIIFLFNYVGVCKSQLGNEALSLLLEPFQNLSSLPKNYLFTDEEVEKNTQDYLAGLNNEDVRLNGTQLLTKYGYKVEVYYVTTTDGYILALYRIPGKGRVVFVMHGILSTFEDWLTIGPKRGLPYLLADLGYDVWMGNARGNTFSKKHVSLSPSDSQFWDFSWDEIGRLDLSAMIDFTLQTTGQSTLTYVGHSQGTTAFFVLCSERPEYNKKINLMVALSAVAWMKNIPNPLVRVIAPLAPVVYTVGRGLGFDDVGSENAITKTLSLALCGNSFLASTVCSNAIFLIAGFDYSQIDFKQSPVIFNHTPGGSALKQLQHFAQLVRSGKFERYDHGTALNLVNYRSLTPPSYPVNKITAPVAIFYSEGDWLASPIDVGVLRNNLANVVDYYKLPLSSFNHIDFLWAKDVKTLVYDRVLQLIGEQNSKNANSTA